MGVVPEWPVGSELVRAFEPYLRALAGPPGGARARRSGSRRGAAHEVDVPLPDAIVEQALDVDGDDRPPWCRAAHRDKYRGLPGRGHTSGLYGVEKRASACS